MLSIQQQLSEVRLGSPQVFRKLTLFPLFGSAPVATSPEYLLLDEAIAKGLARLSEVDGGGSVPEVKFENRANRPVLLLDGQELLGAKQNRVLNVTILAPAEQTTTIPVSCVEAGRWHMASRDFKPADHMMYSRARAARVAQVTASMRTVGLRRSEQSAVWADIEGKADRLGTHSPTGAMSAIYERHAMSLEEYVRSFIWQEDQRGVMFVIGATTIGFDFFDHPATLHHFFEKLVRSYALDALDSTEGMKVNDSYASEFVKRVANAQTFLEAAVGLGKEVRLSGTGLSGAALWADSRYVHLCAFSTMEESSNLRSRISRPTRRWS